MSPDDAMKLYLEAAAESTKRSRLVLLVLIVASVVTFSASWNSSPTSWVNSRYAVANDVIRWWPLLFRNQQLPQSADTTARRRFAQAERYFLKRIKGEDSAQSFETLKHDVEGLHHVRVDDVSVIRVPFFGVLFDVNDLSLVGGFAFFVILLWFFFSLSSERRDLRIAFDFASNHAMGRLCYSLMLMRQVLTVPPRSSIHAPKLFTLLIKALFFLPLFVQLYVVRIDNKTMPVGLSISPWATHVSMAGGFVFLLAIEILTLMCINASWEIDKEWKLEQKRLDRSPA